MQKLAIELNELEGAPLWQRQYVFPEVAAPLTSTHKRDWFVRFSIGGIALVENIMGVDEVLLCPNFDASVESITLRGVHLPIIDCYRHFNLTPKTFTPNTQPMQLVFVDWKTLTA